jgi:hypothetical protein
MMTSVTLQGWLLLSLFFPSALLGEWEARRRAGDWIGGGATSCGAVGAAMRARFPGSTICFYFSGLWWFRAFSCVILGAAGGRGEGPFQVECGSAVSRCRELMYSMYSMSSYPVYKVYSA